MTIIVPNVGEVAMANKILNQNMTLKLYGNDVIPDESTTAVSLNEIVGGGYAAKTLNYANWVISSEGICIYPGQNFIFTGVISAPGSVYGYYIIDADGILNWVERFPTSVLPFVPVADTLIRITPRIRVS